MSMTM